MVLTISLCSVLVCQHAGIWLEKQPKYKKTIDLVTVRLRVHPAGNMNVRIKIHLLPIQYFLGDNFTLKHECQSHSGEGSHVSGSDKQKD